MNIHVFCDVISGRQGISERSIQTQAQLMEEPDVLWEVICTMLIFQYSITTSLPHKHTYTVHKVMQCTNVYCVLHVACRCVANEINRCVVVLCVLTDDADGDQSDHHASASAAKQHNSRGGVKADVEQCGSFALIPSLSLWLSPLNYVRARP